MHCSNFVRYSTTSSARASTTLPERAATPLSALFVVLMV
jgi:hypothetical protein